jgi:hypothetical protein
VRRVNAWALLRCCCSSSNFARVRTCCSYILGIAKASTLALLRWACAGYFPGDEVMQALADSAQEKLTEFTSQVGLLTGVQPPGGLVGLSTPLHSSPRQPGGGILCNYSATRPATWGVAL